MTSLLTSDDLASLLHSDDEAIRRLAATEIRERAVQQARDGDPWPFVNLQWGRVIEASEVIADPGLPARLRAEGRGFLLLDDFQLDIIASLFDPTIREVYVKGNTGCGKNAAAGIALCVYFAVWPDARVVITRDKQETAVEVAYREVEAWWRRMADPPPHIDVQTAGMVDRKNRQHVMLVANPQASEGFTGIHAEHVLMLFDEASAAVLTERFALADTQASKFLALANPRSVSGPFYRAFQLAADPDETQTVQGPYGKRRLITVDGADMLNVKLRRLEKPIAPPGGITIGEHAYGEGERIADADYATVSRLIPGQTGYDAWLGHKKNPDRNWVLCYAHGRFPPEDADVQVILRSWLKAPVDGWRKWRAALERHRGDSARVERLRRFVPIEAFGLDVGASRGGDPSVLTAGGECGIAEQLTMLTPHAGELVAWVVRVAAERYGVDLTAGVVPVGVDAVGIGWGVTAMLRERGVNVVEVKGNDPSDVDPKRYANKRAEMYGELAVRLNPEGEYAGRRFLLPDDDALLADLCAVEKIYKPSGEGLAYAITPKRKVPGIQARVESVEEKLGRSPDRGDSAAYFYRALQVRGVDLSEWLEAGAF